MKANMIKAVATVLALSAAFAAEARPPKPWERATLIKGVQRVPTAAKVPFRLGVARWTFHTILDEQGIQKVLEIMKAVDCHYLGIMGKTIGYDATDEELSAYKAYLASYGIESDTLGPDDVTNEAEARLRFEFAKRYGMKVISLLPCERKTRKVNGKDVTYEVESAVVLDIVERLAKEYDIKVAIHNHGPDSPELYSTADSIWKLIKDRDERIGFCFDMGHELRAGCDPIRAIRKYGKRFHDVHLKNITPHPICNVALPGPRGVLDIPGILQALVDIGYSGVCHIEYETDYKDPAMGLAESMGYYRGVMDMLKVGGK